MLAAIHSKVCINRKFKLTDEYMFNCRNIVLFIKQQHRFFVINRVNGSE